MLVQPTEDEGEVSERPSESQPIPSPTHPSSGGNHGAQAAEIKDLKARIKQLKKKTRPVINHTSWFRADWLKKQQKKKDMEKSKKRRSVSKQGRKAVKSSKGAPSVHTHTDWDAMDTDLGMLRIDLQQSIVKPDEGTDKQDASTVKSDEDQVHGECDTPKSQTMTSTPTPTVFGDDETIAQVLVTMSQNKLKQKEKGIDPKAKGKGMIEEDDESDTESEDINEAEKKFKMLANDEEMARKVQEEWEAKRRGNEKVQEEEREKFTIEERAKLLHDTITARRRFLAQQRSENHSDLKTIFFEEIQVLYEKVKRSDENFIAIGSVEDERLIKDLNKKAVGIKKDDSIKEESKEEEGTKKRKLGTRKKDEVKEKKIQKRPLWDDETNSEKENDELRLCLTIASDEDKEVDYEILDKKYPIIEWKSEYLGNKPQYYETKDLEEINLNVVIRSNGQRRYFSTLMRVLSIFDREDLSVVYQLVMDRYQDEIPECFDRVLWGDLMIMFNPSGKDEFWNSQQDWNVVSWKLHGSSGVHTLMTDEGLVIHMLVEKQYPLRKKVLVQMLELKLESEEDNTMALELIRFVKKLIAELEPENSDGDEKDL
ncbi:hypothetical protein Tco_1282720 [Tanacetum coccineum]